MKDQSAADARTMTMQPCEGCGGNVWWDKERPVICGRCGENPTMLYAVIVSLQDKLDSARRYAADAVRQERERCAEIADSRARQAGIEAKAIASAIRARAAREE